MAESLSDQVREILAKNPDARGAEVSRILGINDRSAHALVAYARRVPQKGGKGGRGGTGGRPTGAERQPVIPESGHRKWKTIAAPVLAFLVAHPEGSSHKGLSAWRRTAPGMSTTKLANALAWLEIQGLARSEGDRHPNRQHSKAKDGASRAHLVRWFGGTPAPDEKDFGDY